MNFLSAESLLCCPRRLGSERVSTTRTAYIYQIAHVTYHELSPYWKGPGERVDAEEANVVRFVAIPNGQLYHALKRDMGF